MLNLTERLNQLTPEQRAELDALLTWGEAPTHVRSFREYVDAVRLGYDWHKHNLVLGNVLQRVADGELTRVMVFMPPRYGKSEEASRLFSGYYLERYPDRWVGLNSYAAELSFTLSRNAREFYRRADNALAGSSATKHWETPDGGGLWAAGVGGPITGKGFHLGIIDDPLKNAEEAASEVIREKQRDWYDSTFYTRQEKDAAIVVIQTRWHDADLAGYLLEKEKIQPEHWHIVDFPAVAFTDEEPVYPATCTVEPDWRDVDEPLCPARASRAQLQAMERSMGAYYWWALFQQRPRPREGGFFKRHWFEIVDRVPEKGRDVRYWDHAATADGGDYTVGLRMRRASDGVCYVLDVTRGRWDSGRRDQIIRATAKGDGLAVHQRREQEPGASGKDAARAFVAMLEGHGAGFEPASGEKIVRADPVASAAEVGKVKLLRCPWNKAFLDEVCAFDKGLHDDQVDALSGAYNYLTRTAGVPMVLPGSIRQVNPWKVATA